MDKAEEKAIAEKRKSSDVMIEENGVTIRLSDNRLFSGKNNPKLSVFREFALGSAHVCAAKHTEIASTTQKSTAVKRQFFTCDLVTQSGLAGLQWKKHLGSNVHVTLVQAKNVQPQTLHDNNTANGFTLSTLPLDISRPGGGHLVAQAENEVHVAQCDPSILMQMEAFDFVYLDPHKNPSPFFSTLFHNVRTNGTVCIVLPDTMHFARSTHVVRRCYGASCIKTEYLKELAVRIVIAALATEAAKRHKGLKVLYSLCMEDFLLVCVQVERGSKHADAMFTEIGTAIHCRICEERVFLPPGLFPVEDPYSHLSCDCKKNVPGKTGVILGPMWKGRIYNYQHLTELAAAGRSLGLSRAFFVLLQKAMEECLCDEPPLLLVPQHSPSFASSSDSGSETHLANLSIPNPATGKMIPDCGYGSENIADSSTKNEPQLKLDMAENPLDSSAMNGFPQECKSQQSLDAVETPAPAVSSTDEIEFRTGGRFNANCSASADSTTSESLDTSSSAVSTAQCTQTVNMKSNAGWDIGESPCVKSPDEQRAFKRPSSPSGAESLPKKSKQVKKDDEPTPVFYYNVHSKRLGKGHLPKQQMIVQCLRSHGYRCCRTLFEKYAIRTNANLKVLTSLLGCGESKVLFVRGEDSHSHV